MLDDRLVGMLHLSNSANTPIGRGSEDCTHGNKFVGRPKPRRHARHECEEVRDAFASRNRALVHFEYGYRDTEERLGHQ
jgi:hypothetical protein